MSKRFVRVACGLLALCLLVARPAYSASETVVYSFKGGNGDGSDPAAGLINIGRALYGTNGEGGPNDVGAVFKVTPKGSETVLYFFQLTDGVGPLGIDPYASLIDVGGVLFGTASQGGANGHGAVFSLTKKGKYSVLYSFAGGEDGSYPIASLTNVGGLIYGATANGGANGTGAVFTVTQTGAEKVLHSFGSSTDGQNPMAGLIKVGDDLYGTTYRGGAHGFGTVFKLTPAGKEKVIYSFAGGSSDGANPAANLINIGTTLYGTTYAGGSGTTGSCDAGCGTAFKVTLSGEETVLHLFVSGNDGANPASGLVNVGGTLYGTTLFGGAKLFGTIFSVTPGGVENVEYTFLQEGGDGGGPAGGLINLDGTLYGTTRGGGSFSQGTVYKFIP